MDWAKAKDILIAALLVTCIMLGGAIIKDEMSQQTDINSAISTAVEYMNSMGASFNCDIPKEQPKLPVLFISFKAAEDESSSQAAVYKNYESIQTGNDNLKAVLVSVGQNKAEIISASYAILNIADKTGNVDGLEINGIRLVYHIEAENAQPGMQDTAMPAWLIDTNRGIYFINAYGQ